MIFHFYLLSCSAINNPHMRLEFSWFNTKIIPTRSKRRRAKVDGCNFAALFFFYSRYNETRIPTGFEKHRLKCDRGMTRAISHGCKQRFNSYRGPTCEMSERGRRCVSLLDQREITHPFSVVLVKLSCHRRADRTTMTERKEENRS